MRWPRHEEKTKRWLTGGGRMLRRRRRRRGRERGKGKSETGEGKRR
jgi:hypothetical protein